MPIEIKCDSCGKRYRAPDKAAGRRVTCKSCGKTIPVPAAQEDDVLAAIESGQLQRRFAVIGSGIHGGAMGQQ